MNTTPDSSQQHHGGFLTLTVAALGVVYGDIGTSPLYAMRECFNGVHAVPPTHDNVLGILSLIFWSLIIVVSIKYVIFVMRADNRGEGGILALLALTLRHFKGTERSRNGLIMLGIFGATMFYGDGVITPAISVLSAVEGLHVATTTLDAYVVPITVVILIALFAVQSHGTAKVGAFFGPVMVVWFLILALLGLGNVWRAPEVLSAFDPEYAVEFFIVNRGHGFLILGAVFLVMTGGEALYADMGHFGRRPIQVAWFTLVIPAILLNYLGQGALMLANPDATINPFYLLAPSWALYPMVALSTLATVIASQAVISGVFSVTRQAVQLGYCQRIEIRHTSEQEIGQIYIPNANWGLLIGVLVLVLGFESSSNLAAAYGIAVTITMTITTILVLVLARCAWGWNWFKIGLAVVFFLLVDLAFFSANALKVLQGGWLPLVIGAWFYLLLMTWREGRAQLSARLREDAMPMGVFLEKLDSGLIHRVPGTAVFLTSNPEGVPNTLLHNLRHNQVVHERLVLLTVTTEEIPRVEPEDRVQVIKLRPKLYRVFLHFGFAEEPNIPESLKQCADLGLAFDMNETTFFLGRETLIPHPRPRLPLWRELLFIHMFRNAERAMDFFQLPHNRVVELGTQIEL